VLVAPEVATVEVGTGDVADVGAVISPVVSPVVLSVVVFIVSEEGRLSLISKFLSIRPA
jgi:hypothetical protein